MSIKRRFLPGDKRRLGDLVRSLLSDAGIRRLRAEYSRGACTVMLLSQQTGVPPVLLYSVVSPIHIGLKYKLEEVPIEAAVDALWKTGVDFVGMTDRLCLPRDIIYRNSFGRFSADTISMRKWYNDYYQVYTSSDTVIYGEDTLPPTSRLGWTVGRADGGLRDVQEGTIGRCPICGNRVYLPCLACRLRADMQDKTFPLSTQDFSEDPVDVLLFK
jgi:hypothetical protein